MLDLELGVAEGALRFFHATVEIGDADAELSWLSRLVADREQRLDEESRRATAEAERAAALLELLRGSLRALLAARGLPVDAAVDARIAELADPAELALVLARAGHVTEAAALFAERAGGT